MAAWNDTSPTPGSRATTAAPTRPCGPRWRASAADPTTYGDALLALQDARLLVPVVAVLGEVEVDEHGLAHDKTSDMAAVLMTGADGRRALLAFTGSDSLASWDAGARPVPVPDPAGRPVGRAGGSRGPRRRHRRARDRGGRGRRPDPPRGGVAGGAPAGRSRATSWAGLAPRRNDPLALGVDRSVPPRHHGEWDRSSKREQHHRSPPASAAQHHRSSGHGPDEAHARRASLLAPAWYTAGAIVHFRRHVSPARVTPTTESLEDTSAPSCASTSGSGFPRSVLSGPMARRSASCRPTRR